MFEPALGHELKPHADAEKGLAAPAHGLFQRLDHPGDAGETLPAIGEGADPGQHDALGAQDDFGLGRHLDREP